MWKSSGGIPRKNKDWIKQHDLRLLQSLKGEIEEVERIINKFSGDGIVNEDMKSFGRIVKNEMLGIITNYITPLT